MPASKNKQLHARSLSAFTQLFDWNIDMRQIIQIEERYYKTTKNSTGAYAAGDYVGKEIRGYFSPSLRLLELLGMQTQAKSILREKAAWLFLCGRDVLPKGIVQVKASKGYTLVCDAHKHILGYGRIERQPNGLFIRNLLDRGDFLRREQRKD